MFGRSNILQKVSDTYKRKEWKIISRPAELFIAKNPMTFVLVYRGGRCNCMLLPGYSSYLRNVVGYFNTLQEVH